VVVPGGFYEIDSLSTPDTLFQLHDVPEVFVDGVARDDYHREIGAWSYIIAFPIFLPSPIFLGFAQDRWRCAPYLHFS